MQTKHHIIYFPGLGDGEDVFQRNAMKWWAGYGFEVHYWPVGWSDDEPFEHKFEELLKRTETLAQTGKVSLIGTSAGAAAALNVFARQKDRVANVVTVCGKILHIDRVEEYEYQKNPALRGGLQMLPESIKILTSEDRVRVLTVKPLTDRRVPTEDAVLPGAIQRTQPTLGHGFSIVYAITLGSRPLANFIRSTNI